MVNGNMCLHFPAGWEEGWETTVGRVALRLTNVVWNVYFYSDS